ncbi:hypothetical protein [Pseudonocardia lacus]|uniref:hypothetical protein n=1 Tax=Pseudonocardia lacus TaxID=2835865 RepID=UPI001BDBBC7F|nr:hypothetical protein [Pseudonocardia lacus]
MNEFVAAPFEERVVRLRVGVEPVDALQPDGLLAPLPALRVHLERVPRPHPLPSDLNDAVGLPPLRRSRSGRFAIVFGSPRTDPPHRLELRIVDPSRSYAPRRLSLPAPDLATVLTAERTNSPLPRGCRAAMFPGAAYPVPPGATAVRGTARFADGTPAPWTRIDATASATQTVPWRAHGDVNGDFLLLVGPLGPVEARRPTATVDVTLTVRARPLPPPATPPDSPTGSRADALWHLPVERVGALGPDPVAAGTVLPPGYTAMATRTVVCRRGATTVAPLLVLT